MMMSLCVGCSANTPVSKKTEPQRKIPVKTVSVTKTEVQKKTTQPATIHAYYRAEIRAMVSGFVSELKADIGDTVEEGATLAVIAVPEMQQQRKVIEARILGLEAEEKQAASGIHLAAAKVRSAQAMLAESKSQLSRADASVAAAEAEFLRTQDLVQRRSLENRMLDEVRKKRDSELANKQAVASAIDSATAEVSVAEAQVAAAEANLIAAKANTEIAKQQLAELDILLAYATIKAPFSGIVSARNIEPGDLVREQNEVGRGGPLFVLSQVDKVRVRIPVPEVDAPHIQPGDQVTLTFPSFPGEEPITRTITRRSGSLDPSTRTMIVEAELPNPNGKLLPGMFGQATIEVAQTVAANILPAQAVRFNEGGDAYVYVVQDDETVSVVDVKTGIDDGHSIEILSGIEAGQRVIDSHLQRFVDGQEVAILNK